MLNGLPAVLNRLGVKNVELASAVGVAEETVSRWANGHIEAPSAPNLIAIWRFLQTKDPSVTLEELDSAPADVAANTEGRSS